MALHRSRGPESIRRLWQGLRKAGDPHPRPIPAEGGITTRSGIRNRPDHAGRDRVQIHDYAAVKGTARPSHSDSAAKVSRVTPLRERAPHIHIESTAGDFIVSSIPSFHPSLSALRANRPLLDKVQPHNTIFPGIFAGLGNRDWAEESAMNVAATDWKREYQTTHALTVRPASPIVGARIF